MDFEELEEQLEDYCEEWCEYHNVIKDERNTRRFINTAIETVENYVSGYDYELDEAYEEYRNSDIDMDLDYYFITNRNDDNEIHRDV